ncbi:c-type cytochrome [Undibacterium sp. TJN19]|uniref:c-type cytochrome n=1 Tax=Undibacterium sp. TJN19 TaxID=3413055 RepID=UPI003BF126C3
MKKILLSLLLGVIAIVSVVAAYGYYVIDDNSQSASSKTVLSPSEQVLKGEYLVRAGNCMGCHTARGEAAFAGGRVLQTEFGNFISPNITPDQKTGIGEWTADDFWQALHNGKGRGGRLLYPAFPYTNYTRVTRADSDAMFAYLKSIPQVVRSNQAHELRSPYDKRALLTFWRALYFRPGVYQDDSKQSADWNRGAYLVNGLGHCSACHSSRNALGANGGTTDLSGGELALTSWYAPSLTHSKEMNLTQWQAPQLFALLKTGVTDHTAVSGPMAEVVALSLQHVSDADLTAMVTYLQAIPPAKAVDADMLDKAMAAPPPCKDAMEAIMRQGGALYKTHCMDCHGSGGEGLKSIYPALKANQSLQAHIIANPVRLILSGGFAPVTKGNPRPYSMPPFGQTLSDSEVALVLSYIRNAWGNQADVVTSAEVNRYRTAPLD